MNNTMNTMSMSHPTLTITASDTLQLATIASAELMKHTDTGKLILNGPDADIDIGGISLKHTLAHIQQRLNLLQPNPELEAEWNQLQVLGEQYRALEAELLKKQRTWNTIKQ